jgi:hypothetical protein
VVWRLDGRQIWSGCGDEKKLHHCTCRELNSRRLASVLTKFFPLASTVLIGPWHSLMDFSIHRHLVGLLGWGFRSNELLGIKYYGFCAGIVYIV